MRESRIATCAVKSIQRRGAVAIVFCLAAALAEIVPVPGSAATPVAPPGWSELAAGPRHGTLWRGEVPGAGLAALYLPPHASAGGRYPMVYIDDPQARSAGRGLGLAGIGDRLIWDGSTPSFAALLLDAPPRVITDVVLPWAEQRLPFVSADAPTLVGVGGAAPATLQAALVRPDRVGTVAALASPGTAADEHADALLIRRAARDLRLDHLRTFVAQSQAQPAADRRRSRQLARDFGAGGLPYRSVTLRTTTARELARRALGLALPFALASSTTRAAASSAAGILPEAWTQILAGPAGGTVWEGRIRNTVVPGSNRDSLVYLPPGTDRARRYPVLYLLHGLRGSPYSFIGGLRLAAIADGLIAARRIRPFIAVMPPAGRTIAFDGEWTGPWERYVVDDVIPWTRAHLPVSVTAAGSSTAGFSAGGYGALDIGLRHPGLFRTLESWSGYYTAPHDGSLVDASAAKLAAHDPSTLVERHAARLRRAGTRILISLGRGERKVQAPARRFAALLGRLGIGHRLLRVRGRHDGKTWRRQLATALAYAVGPSRRPRLPADTPPRMSQR